MNRVSHQFIHEGSFVAEVTVVEMDDGTPWSPSISLDDMRKLDRVRMHLRQGNTAAAGADAQVFEMVPIDAEPATASASKTATGTGFGERTQSDHRSGET